MSFNNIVTDFIGPEIRYQIQFQNHFLPFCVQRRYAVKVIYVAGTTCVGKDTIIQRAKTFSSLVGSVNVGNEFRKRYPPERFRGLGAMQDTEVEALEIFDEQMTQQLELGKTIILVSGQPRLTSQVNAVIGRYTNNEEIWWLNCHPDVIQERIFSRFPDTDTQNLDRLNKASRRLAEQRVQNDARDLYHVLWCIHQIGSIEIVPVKTDLTDFNYDLFFERRFHGGA